ncbi:hypothetical protein RJ641_014900 [Dillenia turbinata]|uniref:Uncharacterized protein n=1 Tax=Dillenia turbinata TaxID=194707 RepID=A0AAN8V589_9MAGN
MEARSSAFSSGLSSSSLGQKPSCHKAAEFVCSTCVLCVVCPLSIIWCCVVLPSKIGWRAVRHAGHHVCCGSVKSVYAASSSFSDIDFDIHEPCKHGRKVKGVSYATIICYVDS